MIQERNEENKNAREPDKIWRIEDFKLGQVIGSGRFGKVYVAQEKKSECFVAIKVISKASITDDMRDQVFLEITIHSIFKHPHIIPLYTFFHNEQNIFTVMEYASSNSLHTVMRAQKFKRFSEDLAAKYICQVADALHHMHCRRYIHRDVKPENVLVDDRGNAKLADFGWATSAVRKHHGYCGTTDYMAPEVIQGKAYNHSVDIWCLGVMTFELLVGWGPFRSSKPTTTQEKILERKINFPQVVKPNAKHLILKLIEINPSKRLPLLRVMNHKWIKSHYERKVLLNGAL
uniref:Aurora kinase n=1 Tax=Lygus hesperus TaxID=30085 RepID=A0A0A9YZI5_LYGHE